MKPNDTHGVQGTSTPDRAAFEKWALGEFSVGFADEDSRLLTRSGDGYDDTQVDAAWRALLHAQSTCRVGGASK